MLRCQGYRFRLTPRKSQAAGLLRHAGCARFVWNELLLQNHVRIERGEPFLRYASMCSYLTYLKREYPFLRNVYSQTLQQTLKDLDTAYRRVFDKTSGARLPKMKKRYRSIGFRFPQGFKICGSSVYLPKIGWMGFRKSREIEGTPTNIVLRFECGHWYITVCTSREVEPPKRAATSAVAIDLGITRFASLSDGSYVESMDAFKKRRHRVAHLQRRLSRKQKFSSNWRKAKFRLSLLMRKIANIRRDMLHKASTKICKNHAVVVLEQLRVSNMSASARGTVESPGTRARSKAALNRRILDQGWAEFRRQISYKTSWAGGITILVDPSNTSRACSSCGYTSPGNRRSQAVFKCELCGFEANADTNAAVNILRRAGRARIACGDRRLRRLLKQEALFAALRLSEKSSVQRGARQKEDVGGANHAGMAGESSLATPKPTE